MIPPEKIEKACELVYERIMGECWHIFTKPYQGIMVCHKCDDFHRNPRLATSLDAWRPLWERMDEKATKWIDTFMYDLVMEDRIKTLWQATPLHHLEAALSAYNLWPELEG